MFILAFSLNWFTTIPGILISLGVVLLIIALILFIVGGKKTKKEEKVVTKDDTLAVENTSNTPEVTPIADVDTNTVEVQPEMSMGESKFEDIQVGTPGIDSINPALSDVASTDELAKVEEVNSVNGVIEEPNGQDLDKTMVSVYGNENSSSEEPKVTIYGGNDPLEATQNLPKVDEHHEPYGGAMNEAKIVEPVEDTVVQIPEVEPIEVPSVSDEPVSIEVPSEPVEIPSESTEIPTVVPNETIESTVKEEKPVVEEL